MNGVVHLLPVHRNFLRGDDAEADLVAADLDHRHGDVIVDDNALVFFSGQYQHCRLSFCS